MIIVIECAACNSKYRLATALFKESRAIGVRCRKCGGCIVVENPNLKDVEEGQRDFPRPVPSPGARWKPEPVQEMDRVLSSTEAGEEDPKEESSVPAASGMLRTVANPLQEIDAAGAETPDTPLVALPEEGVFVSRDLPPELLEPEEQNGRSGYNGSVKVTPHPEPSDGSEALVSVLEDLFRTQLSEKPVFPAEPMAGQSSFPEPGRNTAPKKILPGSSPRPPYLSPLFFFFVVLWILLLAAAVLFFRTDYFERWFPTGKLRSTTMASSGRPVSMPAFEVRNLKWFHKSAFDGTTLFTVTGTVTNLGNPVPWVRVQATIMGKDNVILMDKLVTAGNQIDNTLLYTMSHEEIEAYLSKQTPDGAEDQQVITGQTLPFMAVFFDPPQMVYAVVVRAAAGEDS